MTRRARRLRLNFTDAERQLWKRLRYRQLGVHFRRQYALPPYIVDFACVELKLIIEADGGQHNESAGDALRDRRLEEAGWRLLRFWNNDILDNPEGVTQTIVKAMSELQRQRTRSEPSPQPSPACGGGS